MEVDFLNALRELSQASVALARFERLEDHIAMTFSNLIIHERVVTFFVFAPLFIDHVFIVKNREVINLFIADVLIDFFVIEIDTSE